MVLLVVDAMTGQDAVNVAEQFAEVAQFDGVVLSKLDGDARGGAALSVKAVTGKPILFASTGEKLGHFEQLPPRPHGPADPRHGRRPVVHREGRAVRRRGRGRGAREASCASNQFTLEDFLDQLKRIRKMGPLTSLLGMIPGLAGHQLSKLQVDERELDRVEAIILSMTPEERRRPELIKGSRRLRIAKGSGTTVQQVNQLVKQFGEMRKMMKGLGSGKMPDLGALMRQARRGPATARRLRCDRHVRLHASHPRRREEGPGLAGRRRRPAVPRATAASSRRSAATTPRPSRRPSCSTRSACGWLSQGAQPTDTVRKLLKIQGIDPPSR